MGFVFNKHSAPLRFQEVYFNHCTPFLPDGLADRLRKIGPAKSTVWAYSNISIRESATLLCFAIILFISREYSEYCNFLRLGLVILLKFGVLWRFKARSLFPASLYHVGCYRGVAGARNANLGYCGMVSVTCHHLVPLVL